MFTLRNNVEFTKSVLSSDKLSTTCFRVIYDVDIDGWSIEIETTEIALYSKWCYTLASAVDIMHKKLDGVSTSDLPQDVIDVAREFIDHTETTATEWGMKNVR